MILKIGKCGNDVLITNVLPLGYNDITSIRMWFVAVQKYGFDRVEAIKQIELLLLSEKRQNKRWIDTYRDKSLLDRYLVDEQTNDWDII